jgi:hypothetical protein
MMMPTASCGVDLLILAKNVLAMTTLLNEPLSVSQRRTREGAGHVCRSGVEDATGRGGRGRPFKLLSTFPGRFCLDPLNCPQLSGRRVSS